MAKIIIGKYTKEQQYKEMKKISREIELEGSDGWTAKHKIHASDKTYNRKEKHKTRY